MQSLALLNLLQLASPSLPVGAYSYSEGIESLVDNSIITNQVELQAWLSNELKYGSISLETAIMLQSYRYFLANQLEKIAYSNDWLSAARETAELREQSWQMGQSLWQLLQKLDWDKIAIPNWDKITEAMTSPCNYAIAFGVGAALGEIPENPTIIAYLQSWTNNLILAGVKLIPLGQTQGQQILKNLGNTIVDTASRVVKLEVEELFTCNWGLSLASMAHQHQYTRLFRS